jgi:hypothetical protein
MPIEAAPQQEGVAELLAHLNDQGDAEYAETVTDTYEVIERVYAATMPKGVSVGLAASANPSA